MWKKLDYIVLKKQIKLNPPGYETLVSIVKYEKYQLLHVTLCMYQTKIIILAKIVYWCLTLLVYVDIKQRVFLGQ